MWFLFIRLRTCSSVSVELQETSCCTEISCETFRLAPAAPCSAIARTTSRSVNMPTAVLHSVRTTSLTTSALTLLARINWAAMPTVSFIRMVAIRAVFLRRMYPTFIASSFWSAQELAIQLMKDWYTLCQLSIRNSGSRDIKSVRNTDDSSTYQSLQFRRDIRKWACWRPWYTKNSPAASVQEKGAHRTDGRLR